ncbi:hypothetical protein SLI_4711 [Streptomyces lividans 1326]|uniref:Uncharacterized protein n=1 Tax=Streptomyces lividans 1326 TaxID=1200984 RepID=A0A7U9HCR5_STRLI|nr:hypothetical protein SLI_4711 [Streptomyces lividans 1326]
MPVEDPGRRVCKPDRDPVPAGRRAAASDAQPRHREGGVRPAEAERPLSYAETVVAEMNAFEADWTPRTC